ncbi:N-acetylmuramoyl-L-alanine amidase [Staphylococcus auricularis]|uniref:N-acetylmuramoyl-L-alanine amidase n=1 Tax=Staphylococcus auricularis TaxID=29379 RepID=UPI001247188C|nr:N-acetylmuramoyl-L-alanine amidase [Staphylococcus auricularis]
MWFKKDEGGVAERLKESIEKKGLFSNGGGREENIEVLRERNGGGVLVEVG